MKNLVKICCLIVFLSLSLFIANFSTEIFSIFKHLQANQTLCTGINGQGIGSVTCLSVFANEKGYSEKRLKEILTTVKKSQPNVQQARIRFSSPLNTDEINQIGAILDEFLTTQLWWTLQSEPYEWQKDNNQEIFLEKYSSFSEPFLRHLSSVQYPDNKTCNKMPMLVHRSNAVHPGWASILESQHYVYNILPYFVSANYVSVSNNPSAADEFTAWIAPHECNTTINKWDCAFLSSTSCNIPDIVTQCRTKECVKHLPDSFENVLMFNSASSSGSLVPKTQAEMIYSEADELHKYRTPHSKLQFKYSNYADLLPSLTILPPYNKTRIRRMSPQREPPATTEMLYIFRHLLRNNYRLRSLIAKLIHDFYLKNEVNHNTRCVAAQVRRGDRIIKGVDMAEFCKNLTRKITVENPVNYCQDGTGNLVVCTVDLGRDKGCEKLVPLGAVTLEMIIKAAGRLAPPEVKTLIVFTDDEAWLESEKIRVKSKYPEWKIVNLEAPKSAELENNKAIQKSTIGAEYEIMRYGGGSQSGAFFLGSLQLAQQCEGFVGHFASAVTNLFYTSMCYKNSNGKNQGVCPPLLDLGTTKIAL